MTEVIETLDARALFEEMQPGSDEFGTEAIVDELIMTRAVTFEDAREILFGLISAKKLTLTPRYTVRLP